MKHFLHSLLCLLLAGCGHVHYYGQAIGGHLDIMQRSKAVDELLATDAVPADLQQRLRQAQAIRTFASRSLHLPDNDSYRSYADLERRFVVWNVIATPALSLEPRQWCFPFAGCLAYRGYYAEADALAYAEQIDGTDTDVYVGGAAAYSTLGWFDDPLLNTMLYRDETRLAEVIFHELAHQQVFIANDTAFNEAFAETVAIAGTRHWLDRHAGSDVRAAYETRLQRETRLLDMIFATRRQLEAVYTGNASNSDKRRQKQHVLADLVQRYWRLRAGEWQGFDDYDDWFSGGMNNAKLAAVTTYRDLVPDFMRLLQRLDHDFERFYQQVAMLDSCTAAERRRWLTGDNVVSTCSEGS